MRSKWKQFFLLLMALLPTGLLADPFEFSGHIQEQSAISHFDSGSFEDLVGPSQPINQLLDIRLNSMYRTDHFQFVSHNELLGAFSDAPFVDDPVYPQSLRRSVFQTDDRRLFDLSKTFLKDENGQMAARFDRLYAEYARDELVLRVGRQAITWGNGLVFQTLDLFNPFSPTEVNRDYKVGDDLLYAQWLLDSGDDIQFLVVPRRDIDTGDVEEDQTSYAVKYKGRFFELYEYDLLFTRHYGEELAGAGVSREIFGALWRTDIVAWEIAGASDVSLVSNIDRSWTLAGINIYGFLEYFYSGVGTDKNHYLMPPSELSQRLRRQELFTLGRNYLAAGFQIEVHPLLNIVPSHILNLNDSSGIAQVQFRYDMLTTTSLVVGIDLPYGGKGTEFGGVFLPGDVHVDTGERYYARLTYFF